MADINVKLHKVAAMWKIMLLCMLLLTPIATLIFSRIHSAYDLTITLLVSAALGTGFTCAIYSLRRLLAKPPPPITSGMAALAQKARKGKLTKKQRVARANAEGEKKRGNTRPQRMKRIKDKDEKERAWMARPHRFVNEMGPVLVIVDKRYK